MSTEIDGINGYKIDFYDSTRCLIVSKFFLSFLKCFMTTKKKYVYKGEKSEMFFFFLVVDEGGKKSEKSEILLYSIQQ